MFDLIDLVSLAGEFSALKVLSRSTLYKLSSGNYPKNGHFDDFPPAIRLGGKTFWRKSAIEAWVNSRTEKALIQANDNQSFQTQEALSQKSSICFGRGRPTRNEQAAARAAGLTIREYRSCVQGMQA